VLLTEVAASKDLGVVMSRLAAIETQQCQQTQLLQKFIAVLQKTGADGSDQLPEGVVLLYQSKPCKYCWTRKKHWKMSNFRRQAGR